jgi:hypothetical protein
METVYNWVMSLTADDYFRLKVIGMIAGVLLMPVAAVVGTVIAFRDYKVKRERREKLLSRLRR